MTRDAETRWVETPWGSIEVTIAGPREGAPLLFVHGALVAGDLWAPVVTELARTHRCYVPTLPLGSHVRAMRSDAALAPPDVADLVVEIADALGLGALTIVANDSGGAVSQLVAVRHRARVRGLVLTNCDALEVFPPFAFAYLKTVATRPWLAGAVLRAMVAAPVLGLAPNAWGGLARDITTRDVRRWATPGAESRDVREDFAKFAGGIGPRVTLDAAAALSARPVPIQLVWGAADPYFRRSLAERFVAGVPGARVHFVEGARTFVMRDAPAELARAIRAFDERLATGTSAQAS